ncbi:hypothetical protein [Brevibacterium linens]|uniref:hypothetical protein n=1 Tax=Brevibacterium linens TaxID=1703 RepID=UPI003BF5EB63
MTEPTDFDDGEQLQPEDLTTEEEHLLLTDTSVSNGESDFPDPEQDFDLDAIDEDPDYDVEED